MKLHLHRITFFVLFFSLFIANQEIAHSTQSNSHSSEKNMELFTVLSETEVSSSLSELIKEIEKSGYDIKKLLEDPRFEIYEGISERFINSAEKKTLGIDDYKKVLGFETKKGKISEFIESHIDQLNAAEKKYGIPKYVIAAIIGIESDFGKNIGSFNPFNAYVSMYVEEYRGPFALAQLKELLEFTQRNNIDIFELKSSYAGAMAFAQFIPYSLNKWFVGSDIYDMDNNIMSVGNYLAYFKERTGTIEKAVFRYNPSSLYAEAVLLLAGAAEEMFVH